MRNFLESIAIFSECHQGKFSPFSATHIVTIVVLIIIFLGFVRISKWFMNDESRDRYLRFSVAGFLFFMDLIYNLWILQKDGFSISALPLHLCDVINFLTIATLLLNSAKIAGIVYYWTLLSTPLALIFPSIAYGPLHFRFSHYFLLHIVQMLGNVYFIITRRAGVSSSVNIQSIFILTILSSIMLAIDFISGENWFYMVESPLNSISDFLGFPLYTITWMSLNTLLMRLSYYITRACIR